MPRIDAHLHVFTRESAEFPRNPTKVCPAERAEPVGKFLTKMEESRIDQAVLVQFGGGRIEDHAYLRHCLATYPDRFLGIGLFPPDRDEPETHMDRLAEDGGLMGFRLGLLGGPSDPNAPMDVRRFSSYRIWKHAAERDYVLWLYTKAPESHLIPPLLEAFPQVRVVMNHLGICPGRGKFSWDEKGRPHIDTPSFKDSRDTICRLARYENVSVHLSGQYAFSREAFPYRDLAEWHRTLFDVFGPERLMWGTDAPWIYEDPGYGALTTIIRELLPNLPEADYADMMGGTAHRFLRFPALRGE